MLLLTMTVLLRLFNHHYVHLPSAIMMSLGSITCTGALLLVGLLPNVDMGFALAGLRDFLMNFPDLLLKYMLGFLLFAAAIEVDLRALRRIRTTVIALSVFTTAISCGIVSVLTWLLLRRICPMDFAWCLLFGAIVSPTDPVAVMSLLSAKPTLIPASTRYFVLGESLFNDAVGVVLYLVFVETVEKPDMPVVEVWRLFFRGFGLECLTGIGIGLVFSWLAYSAIQTLDDSLLEITISIVLVGNINLACNYFHASIPLASVTAGLFIGNYGVAYAMSDDTSALFHQLWKFLDETLNSVLFLLVGAADLFWNPQDIGLVPYAMVMVATIAISLFARIISVAAPLLSIVALEIVTGRRLRHRSVRYRGGTIAVLTWGGVRGGISIALALGVPDAFVKHAVPGHMTYGQLIFLMTFTLVVFSICGQGLLFETVVTLIEDMSYTFLPHGGLSTFKSSMSLAFDQESAVSVDGRDWALLPHSDSWADEEAGGAPAAAGRAAARGRQRSRQSILTLSWCLCARKSVLVVGRGAALGAT
ncbi:hypothetical protein BU14_0022s0073 [Porphyra umbilicalis]|uniref:Cation/H+ exchanger transmembrane domain-containing protein n=1 Tax=Porphyra umbilicalis TaxID=2786 RepID=A0A1X6PKB6_PORUM|nr:hypothetical protein BU14_0022s0073 [Porphyra umbilicalis]|eukprot:OSX81354.1 hypothetical protein BU14_0022s0073 [Porphyra umbilicalis]